jgi:hypothetical protein
MRDFEKTINHKISQIPTNNYKDLEKAIIKQRISWARQHRQPAESNATPREAYEMLFFEIMKLDPAGVTVLSDNDQKITWSSTNTCDTLEACLRTGNDTRIACQEIYEKSTQALVSELDPQIRFYRSYDEIRPYSHQCLEWLIRMDFQ